MNPSLPIYGGRFALLWHDLTASTEIDVEISLPSGLANDDQTHSHWDLLLELDNGQLLTWRLPGRPLGSLLAAGNAFSACRLANHRGLYLNYEGPISGDRGSIKRIAWGRYRAKTFANKSFDCEFIDPVCQRTEPETADWAIPSVIVENSVVLQAKLKGETNFCCVFQATVSAIGEEVQFRVLE